MKFHVLFLSACSASFELDNEAIYEAPEAFNVKLDGWEVLKGWKRNVFSLYELKDDTDYEVSVGADSLRIHTPALPLILHMKDFVSSQDTDDTLRIQNAIACLPEGGKLVFDPGDYHLTSIFLKSHMTIEIMKGAHLYGNPSITAYPLMPGEVSYNHAKKKLQLMAWEGGPYQGMPSMFTAYYQSDITIVGEGIVDGSADASGFWIDVKNLKWARPRIFFFNQCEDITLQGITVQDSPSWSIHPYFSKRISLYDVQVNNPKDAPNTDGVNPECCSDVQIIGVRFSVGDDCIALKSGKIYTGKMYKTPCERITIRNCYMSEGHGAIVLGSEAGAGIKDLTVERCLFENTDRGFRIKSRRGRGKDSVIDGVVFKNIRMKHVLTPLVINMFYFCDPDGKDAWVQDKKPAKVDETTPYLGSFEFDNLVCTDAEYALGFFYGLPEQPIGSIIIRNSTFSVKKDAGEGLPAMMCGIEACSKVGFFFSNVSRVELDHVKAEGYVGEETIQENVASFTKT